jgi:hypothetical protein
MITQLICVLVRQSHLPACVSRTYRRARDGGDVSTLTRAPAVAASLNWRPGLLNRAARPLDDPRLTAAKSTLWDSTNARWKCSAPRPPRRKRPRSVRARDRCSRMPAAWSRHGMNQAKRMPMLFSPTIGCVLKARHWFLGVRSRACRTTQAVDLRTLDRHPWSAISSLIPSEVVPRLLATRSIRRACPPVRHSPTNRASNTSAGRWATERQMRYRRARATKRMAVSAWRDDVTAWRNDVMASVQNRP